MVSQENFVGVLVDGDPVRAGVMNASSIPFVTGLHIGNSFRYMESEDAPVN
jgi:hypothetical protein